MTWVPGRWDWAVRLPRTSTAPLEGCTHIDEVLSAAPPDVEGSTLVYGLHTQHTSGLGVADRLVYFIERRD